MVCGDARTPTQFNTDCTVASKLPKPNPTTSSSRMAFFTNLKFQLIRKSRVHGESHSLDSDGALGVDAAHRLRPIQKTRWTTFRLNARPGYLSWTMIASYANSFGTASVQRVTLLETSPDGIQALERIVRWRSPAARPIPTVARACVLRWRHAASRQIGAGPSCARFGAKPVCPSNHIAHVHARSRRRTVSGRAHTPSRDR